MQGGAVTWQSKRQPTVALSSTEAEYMALCSAAQEAIWLQQFGNEFLSDNNNHPITIYCDNRSAICLSSNDVYRPRTKHIEVKISFLTAEITSCSY